MTKDHFTVQREGYKTTLTNQHVSLPMKFVDYYVSFVGYEPNFQGKKQVLALLK